MNILIAKDAISTSFRKMWPFKTKKVIRGVVLTRLVEDRIDAVFDELIRDSAREILREQCGMGLPLMHTAVPKNFDRIRLAVVKLSGGTIEGLEHGIREAHTDWRDVLMEAGFANNEEAHLKWNPRDMMADNF